MNMGRSENALSIIAKEILVPMFAGIATAFGKDAEEWYTSLRNKRRLRRLAEAATQRGYNAADGKQLNERIGVEILRITQAGDDSDDYHLADEYLGGLFVASRSEDGRNESELPLLDLIRSLSPTQLLLHYQIYHCLNELLIEERFDKDNLGTVILENEHLYLSAPGKFQTSDVIILKSRGLISYYQQFRVEREVRGISNFRCLDVVPSELGVLLYMAADGRPEDTAFFGEPNAKCDDIEGVELPRFYSLGPEELNVQRNPDNATPPSTPIENIDPKTPEELNRYILERVNEAWYDGRVWLPFRCLGEDTTDADVGNDDPLVMQVSALSERGFIVLDGLNIQESSGGSIMVSLGVTPRLSIRQEGQDYLVPVRKLATC